MSTQPEPRPNEQLQEEPLRFIEDVQHSKQPAPKRPQVFRLKKQRPEVGPLERLLDLSA